MQAFDQHRELARKEILVDVSLVPKFETLLVGNHVRWHLPKRVRVFAPYLADGSETQDAIDDDVLPTRGQSYFERFSKADLAYRRSKVGLEGSGGATTSEVRIGF
jgi:hypothetical protein